MDFDYPMFPSFLLLLILPFSEKHSHPPQYRNLFLSPDCPPVLDTECPLF